MFKPYVQAGPDQICSVEGKAWCLEPLVKGNIRIFLPKPKRYKIIQILDLSTLSQLRISIKRILTVNVILLELQRSLVEGWGEGSQVCSRGGGDCLPPTARLITIHPLNDDLNPCNNHHGDWIRIDHFVTFDLKQVKNPLSQIRQLKLFFFTQYCHLVKWKKLSHTFNSPITPSRCYATHC